MALSAIFCVSVACRSSTAMIGVSTIAQAADPLKVCFLYVGSKTDGGWTQAHELGRQAKERGLRLYTHNHDAAYAFLLDAGPLDGSGKHASPPRSCTTCVLAVVPL